MSPELTRLKAENFANASASMWVLKKTATQAIYTAKAVRINADLHAKFIGLAESGLGDITEDEEYSILAQSNENSALTIPVNETRFGEIAAIVNMPQEDAWVDNVKQLKNTAGYIIKLALANGECIYCVRKTTADWTAEKKNKYITTMFSDLTLEINENPVFKIDKFFDCYVYAGKVFIKNKPQFETIFQFK